MKTNFFQSFGNQNLKSNTGTGILVIGSNGTSISYLSVTKIKLNLPMVHFPLHFKPLDPDLESGFPIRIHKVIESGPTTMIFTKKKVISH
jgi:hypothetical protein